MASGLLYFHFFSRKREQKLFYVKQVQKFKDIVNTSEIIRKDNLYKTFCENNIYKLGGLSQGFFITQGVKDIADKFKMYSILDIICVFQDLPALDSNFQVWNLARNNLHCILSCADFQGSVLYKQYVDKSDYSGEGLKLFVVGKVIMLPAEY